MSCHHSHPICINGENIEDIHQLLILEALFLPIVAPSLILLHAVKALDLSSPFYLERVNPDISISTCNVLSALLYYNSICKTTDTVTRLQAFISPCHHSPISHTQAEKVWNEKLRQCTDLCLLVVLPTASEFSTLRKNCHHSIADYAIQ